MNKNSDVLVIQSTKFVEQRQQRLVSAWCCKYLSYNLLVLVYFGRSSIGISFTVFRQTARSIMAVFRFSSFDTWVSLATLSRNVSGRLSPRSHVDGSRIGSTIDIIWSETLIQWPANLALRWANTVTIDGGHHRCQSELDAFSSSQILSYHEQPNTVTIEPFLKLLVHGHWSCS